MTRNYRLTKEQSDEFCKTVKEVLKKIKVSQTRLGEVAGYSRQSICMILGQRSETITRSQYMSIISALAMLVMNSSLNADMINHVIDEQLRPLARFALEF